MFRCLELLLRSAVNLRQVRLLASGSSLPDGKLAVRQVLN